MLDRDLKPAGAVTITWNNMPQQIFKSKYPILEACMNRGSTLPLALAVHDAGGYPSLCSWTYGTNYSVMQAELNKFVTKTNSNKIQLSFEIEQLPNKDTIVNIVKSHNIPTIEIIYGLYDSDISSELDAKIKMLLAPVAELGVKIFKRAIRPVTQAEMDRYFLTGLCLKGVEAAGYTSNSYTTRQLFDLQRTLTPDALLIPYGGVGTAGQVKEYIDLGCEMVGVGTVLAFSQEGVIKEETKQAVVKATVNDLSPFEGYADGKQNALKFDAYSETDDKNHSIGLKKALWEKDTTQGHVFVGHSVEHIREILPCVQIIENLVKDLE